MSQAVGKHEVSKAIPFILIAGLFLALIGFLSKIELKESSLFWVFLARSATNLLIAIPLVLRKKHRLTHLFKRPKRRLLLARGIVSFIAAVLLIIGSYLMPISVNTILFCTAPLFVPLIVRIWLKIPLVHRLWWGLGVAFLGILLILHPLPSEFHWISFIPLMGGILSALSTVIARQLTHTDPPEIIIFYYSKVSCLFTLFFLLDPATYQVVFTLKSLGTLFLLGLCFFGYQYFFTMATAHASARFISPFLYSSTLFSLIPEIFLFHYVPKLLTLVGIFFVIMGTVLTVLLFPKNGAATVKNH